MNCISNKRPKRADMVERDAIIDLMASDMLDITREAGTTTVDDLRRKGWTAAQLLEFGFDAHAEAARRDDARAQVAPAYAHPAEADPAIAAAHEMA